jgi:hypothetical protein
MKFKNISNKSINIKLGSDWTTIQPSMTYNLPEYLGMKFKELEKIEKKQEVKLVNEEINKEKEPKKLKKKSKKKVKKSKKKVNK